ncbi:MAG TPA: FctA domain-containing protein [Clostridiales bacterium]|nr:FctA domain-containing protein [Clostridiales bacterium]
MELTKKHSFFKAFFVLALTAILCLGSFTPVFAAGNPIAGDKATIKKSLQMLEGTPTPDATFTFTFEKISLNGQSNQPARDNMPNISPQNITFAASDGGDIAGFSKTVSKESGNFFAGVAFPSPGVYIYILTETADTYPIADPNLETMNYSGAVYEITAYVENGATGPELKHISAVINKRDFSNGVTEGKGDKVDPTPGSSTLVFTNTYMKIPGGGTPQDGALAISKTVSGEYADMDKYFEFTIRTSVEKNIQTGTATYKAYLLEDNTVITPTAQNGAFQIEHDGSNDYIVVTAGSNLSIQLKHNQKLVFTDIPIGASYEAIETATANYAPSIALMVDGTPNAVPNSTVGIKLSTSERIIGEDTNSAVFTNTFDTSITPTGISLNDLPFIMMIALAIGALVLFVIVKSRRKSDVKNC